MVTAVVSSASVFLEAGFCTPGSVPANCIVVQLPGDCVPDLIAERYDATSPTRRRLATAQELADAKAARIVAQATTTSREKDVLATCAEVVRARGIAAWNAMTVQQKIDAILAEADVWKTIRIWIEANIP